MFYSVITDSVWEITSFVKDIKFTILSGYIYNLKWSYIKLDVWHTERVLYCKKNCAQFFETPDQLIEYNTSEMQQQAGGA